ncbi:MAG: ribonuclease P protein component, partial [Saprospiraceae bacterium]|nr:ribonuclease P protein component [Saprospiraceae bacterium]
DSGKSVQVYPLRLFYEIDADETREKEIKVTFAVSRRNLKKAVDRNHIKRLMRESYRLNQYQLKDQLAIQGTLNLVFLYYIKDKFSFSAMEKATIKVLGRLVKELKNPND